MAKGPSIREIVEAVLDEHPEALDMPDGAFREVFAQVASQRFGIGNPKEKWKLWSVERVRFAVKKERSSPLSGSIITDLCDKCLTDMNSLAQMPTLFHKGQNAHKQRMAASLKRLSDMAASIDPESPAHVQIVGTAVAVDRGSKGADVISFLEAQKDSVRRDAESSERLFNSVREHIVPAVFVYGLALFDGLIASVTKADFLLHPKQLSGMKDKKVSYVTILESPTRADIIDAIAESETLQITRQDIAHQVEHLRGRGVSFDGIDELALVELLTTRNIYVHNNGIVNDEYLRCSRAYWTNQKKRPPKKGKPRSIAEDYVSQGLELTAKVVGAIRTHFATPKLEPIAECADGAAQPEPLAQDVTAATQVGVAIGPGQRSEPAEASGE